MKQPSGAINDQKCDKDVQLFASFIWDINRKQVAEMQAVSIPTIYAWINRWRKGGIEALATQPRSGRPPKADEAYSRLLGEVMEKEPAELGYGLYDVDD